MEKHGGAIGRENHRYLPDAHRARAAASNRARALVRAGKGEARRDTDCGQNSPRSGPEIKAHSLRHIQHRPDESKAYCTRKMVLTMGSTLLLPRYMLACGFLRGAIKWRCWDEQQ